MHRRSVLAAALAATACTSMPTSPSAPASARDELRAAENRFAATMARRDFQAFQDLIAEDAVFISSGRPLHGRATIAAAWKKYFDDAQAPFSWKPEIAEVNGLGDLGYTRGPVAGPDGQVFAHFHSTWRRGADGRWQVVFDNGERCDCTP